ncbi:MAG: transcription antitermination factor NusB [Bdellovibrionales bacterium]
MMSLRTRSRELTLQLLFEKEFQQQGTKSGPSEELIHHAQQITEEKPQFREKDVTAYALVLFNGYNAHQETIDNLISTYSQNWKLSRMSIVDRNILRIATFELLQMGHEVPPAAVINEAVEMAKRFGTTDSSSFINGVLDQIARNPNKMVVDESTNSTTLKSS